MLTRIEVLELVDAVEDVSDQLLQEQSRRHTDLPSEGSADGPGEVGDVRVVG